MTVSYERIVLALDLDQESEALEWARRLRGRVGLFKVGLRLFMAAGPDGVRRLISECGPVFLDLKLHDIPTTVAAGVREAAKLGVSMLTVHASGGLSMLRAAAEAASEDRSGASRTRILAVTVLTSLDARDLAAAGIARSISDQVLALAECAWLAGCDGIVASPREAAAIRARLGPSALIVTPGVRLEGSRESDQKRTSTPRQALRAGADYLVIGRPILEADDPEGALALILASLEGDSTR